MKKFVLFLILLFPVLMTAQDNYQVIVIPTKFSFQKREDQFNINTICKLFFEKEGFKVISESEELNEDFYKNRCHYLYLNINDIGSILTIKVNIDLRNCKNEILLQSKDVKTKEKDFHKGYNEVVREALIGLRGKLSISNTIAFNSKTIAVESETTMSNAGGNLSQNDVLKAVKTEYGYYFADENNKVVFELIETSNPSIFIAKKGYINGVLTLNGNVAKFEYHEGENLISEKVEVKF